MSIQRRQATTGSGVLGRASGEVAECGPMMTVGEGEKVVTGGMKGKAEGEIQTPSVSDKE